MPPKIIILLLPLFVFINPNKNGEYKNIGKSNSVKIENIKIDSIEIQNIEIENIKNREIENKIGRKLKLKEKISIYFLKKKLSKNKFKFRHFVLIGLLLSILGFFIFPLGIILSFIGAAIGIISLVKIRRSKGKLKGKFGAWLSIILGLISVTIQLVLVGLLY